MSKSLSKIHSIFLYQKEKALEAYRKTHKPFVYSKRYSLAIYELLSDLWTHYFHHAPLALLATGGLGRGELYPYSDLDFAIVSPHALSAEHEEKARHLVQTLWDMGLQPAPKIGSVSELCHAALNDLTGDTALLESRFVCGHHHISREFRHKLTIQRDLSTFIEGKLLEQEHRHMKAQGSSLQLEPNVKTCQGGLRDIHTILWLAKAQGLPPSIASLVSQHILTREEARILMLSHRQLSRIRIELHLAANRAEERLLFEYQTKIAEQLGFYDDDKGIKSEYLMTLFYRATKTVKQLNGILLPMLKGRVYSEMGRQVFDISSEYYQLGHLIAAKNKLIFQEDPTQIFKMAAMLQDNKDITGIAPKTLRAWWAASQSIDADFYQNPINREYFVRFFKKGTGLTHLLRILNTYGILGRYLPAFGKVTGLLQHDLFHVYPVDEHILMVVRNMRRLALEAHYHELPSASSLMQQFEDKHILYLAALFHDIAKGRGGDHAILAVEDTTQFAKDHFLSPDETALLVFLVRYHLLFSMVAQKQDIHDPDVIAHFCSTVDTPKKLIALYLLTVADIRGTNPSIWNQWKADLFKNLFQLSLAYLEGKGNNTHILVGRRKQLALSIFAEKELTASEQKQMVSILGNTYFVHHTSEEIKWHLNTILPNINSSHFDLRKLNERTLEVMIYLPNKPRIFAGLCQIFRELSLDILNARAYLTEHQYVLDTFIVSLASCFAPEDFLRIQEILGQNLLQFIDEEITILKPITALKSRRSKHIPIVPTVSITADEDIKDYYNLNVVSVDFPGLLANMAKILSDMDISIRHARILTLGERVEDSFLLYSPHLKDTETQLKLKRMLLNLIET